MNTPGSKPFPQPPAGTLSYLFFGHVAFAVSDGAGVVIIDPFFEGSFFWKDHDEKRLAPPEIRPEAIPRVGAVLVSHEHLDHWDAPSVRALTRGGAKLVAPVPTLNDMGKAGLDTAHFTPAESGKPFTVASMTITAFPSIESESQPGPPQRVGYLVEGHGAAFYHQGDSHGPAKAWQAFRPRLDTIVIWPWYVDHYLMQLAPPHVVFHHMDRFEPGGFFCNRDERREVEYWQYRYPKTRFTSPPRNTWLPVKNPPRD